MKKLLILIIVLLLTGCSGYSDYYRTSNIGDVRMVSELSSDLYLYEKKLDTNTRFRRYYYVGDINKNVYRELVTFFGFGNDELDLTKFEYNFIGAHKSEVNGCLSVGIEIEILDEEGSQVYHRKEEGDNEYISYCVENGKPYKGNNV